MATAHAHDSSIPSTLNLGEAKSVLDGAAREADFVGRLDFISGYFLDRPYIENSLVGGLDTPEVLTISLDAFDCVTYIETILALAASTTVEGFIGRICRLRYKDGEIDWAARNHYMIDWARNNEAQGLVENLTKGGDTVERSRTLRSVEGLQARQVNIRSFPKRRLAGVSRKCQTGDLIFFASTRRSLDVFHIGLLIERNGELLMRHATRTAGGVIEQELEGFVTGNRMSGLIILRPHP